MTDSENDERRKLLAANLRIEAERNREMAVLSEGLPVAVASCLRRAQLYEAAAAEIEALNAECKRRMNDADMAFRQAMANGEAASDLRDAASTDTAQDRRGQP